MTQLVVVGGGELERQLGGSEDAVPGLGGRDVGAAELGELLEGAGEVGEEAGLVPAVELDVAAEGRVLDERQVRGQHHEVAAVLVLVLQRALPLLGHPLALEQQPKVLVAERRRGAGPRAQVPAAVCGAGGAGRHRAVRGRGAESGEGRADLCGIGRARARRGGRRFLGR